MPLVQWNQEIKAFSPYGADEPLTKSIRLRRSKRRPQNSYAERVQRRIKFCRVDVVPVVEDEPIRLLARDDVPKLLERPGRCRMSGDVEVRNLACPYFHGYKNIEDSKVSGYDDKEIAGQHRLSVISNKRHPPLGRDAFPRSNAKGHVAPHRPR